jgi:predicted transcriptional regulator
MKSVLISIQPKWCELIASGEKTVEVRKTRPKLETPFKVYIYCTTDKRLLRKFDKGERIDDEHFFDEHVFVRQNTWIRGHFNPNKKVIGEFVCDRIVKFKNSLYDEVLEETVVKSCVSMYDLLVYIGKQDYGYGWHISDLVIYDKPRELSEFKKPCNHKNDCCTCDRYDYIGHRCYEEITRPPQSWCYVERSENGT